MNRKLTFKICFPIVSISFAFFFIFFPFFIKVGFSFPIHSASDYGHRTVLVGEQGGYEPVVGSVVGDGFSFNDRLESGKWLEKSIEFGLSLFSSIETYIDNEKDYPNDNSNNAYDFSTSTGIEKSDHTIPNRHDDDIFAMVCGVLCLYSVVLYPFIQCGVEQCPAGASVRTPCSPRAERGEGVRILLNSAFPPSEARGEHDDQPDPVFWAIGCIISLDSLSFSFLQIRFNRDTEWKGRPPLRWITFRHLGGNFSFRMPTVKFIRMIP